VGAGERKAGGTYELVELVWLLNWGPGLGWAGGAQVLALISSFGGAVW